jgi:hypothetical protein
MHAQAVLAIRQLALCIPSPFIDKCLRVRGREGRLQPSPRPLEVEDDEGWG